MRKEVKNFSFLWWVVLAGLMAPSFFSRFNNDPSKRVVAHVNGDVIDMARFKRQYSMMQSERQMFNQRYGLNLDLGVDPSSVLERSSEALLVDAVARDQRLIVDPSVLGATIRKSLSALFGINKESFNVGLYSYYIRQSGMTIREFEEEQESVMRNAFVEEAVQASAYIPRASRSPMHSEKKSFSILRFDKDAYVKAAKAVAHDEEALSQFFQLHKENYKLPDVKRVAYVVVNPASYAKNVTVSDEQVEAFYNRRKDTQFKDKDHYKMRRMLIAIPEGASADDAAALEKKAHEVYGKIMVNKNDFDDLAKAFSDDSKTAKKGGMTEDFVLGTSFNPELEDALSKLSTNGDVTPLVRTNEGFECAQLVSKKVGAYRSLDSVRKEIISTLTQRSAMEHLRSDIDALMRDAQGGDVDLAGFAENHGIKVEETGEIDSSVAHQDGLKGDLARKVFGSFSSKPLSRGSFVSGDKHVVFVVIDAQSNRYSELSDIKSKVFEDMYKQQASEALAKDVMEARKAYFDEQKPLSELAAAYKHAAFHETGLIKKGDSIKGVDKDSSVSSALFKLEDPSMLAKATSRDGDIILASLISTESSKDASPVASIIPADIKDNLVSGFIASLKRNARIEVNDDQISSGS